MSEKTQKQLIKTVWTILILAAGLFILFSGESTLNLTLNSPWQLAAGLFSLAFFSAYIDTTLGMGYGTTMTPVLLILGFQRIDLVPAVLISQIAAGSLAGISHHRAGNVDLIRDSQTRKQLWMLSVPTVLGSAAAVILGAGLYVLEESVFRLYIGLMVFGTGLFLVIKNFREQRGLSKVSPKCATHKLLTLGTIAAFNKALSGGGYGPLMTGGQLLAGVKAKSAVVITTMTETLASVIAILGYLAFSQSFDLKLAMILSIGAMLSVPAAAWTIRLMPSELLKSRIGAATCFLGFVTIWRFFPG